MSSTLRGGPLVVRTPVETHTATRRVFRELSNLNLPFETLLNTIIDIFDNIVCLVELYTAGILIFFVVGNVEFQPSAPPEALPISEYRRLRNASFSGQPGGP